MHCLVIHSRIDNISASNVTVLREIFNTNHYTVFLDLNEVQIDVVYNITIVPQGSTTIEFPDDTNFQLTLAYETVYYVYVVAISTLCQLNSVTTSIRLYHGKSK